MRAATALLLGILVSACSASHDREGGGSSDGGRRSDAGAGSDATVRVDAGPLGDCENPTDCALTPASCCGDCGTYTRDDIASVPKGSLDAHREAACADPVACPACFRAADPALLADCQSNACTYVDFYNPETDHRSEYTACEADDDCVLRVVQCCECGSDPTLSNTVAVRRDKLADLERLLCAPGTACDDCLADYSHLFTWCGGDTATMPARCRVDFLGP